MIIFLFTAGVETAFAQLQIFPIQRNTLIEKQNTTLVENQKTRNTAARTKSLALTLPFWDDFSTTSGLFPDTVKWNSSYTVWVNDGMAINSPTMNVATFDGLDSAGRAYNLTEILVSGFTDSLVSKPINLSETGVKPVAVNERGTVYLSFFYQWRGNGEAPDDDDFLQLQFKTDAGVWETVMTIATKKTFNRELFYDTIIQVSGTKFFHNAFQFRFRSYGRQSGPYDTWNIDYIYLNKNRNANDDSFPDRAAASALSPLFRSYRSVPYRHFLNAKQLDTVEFDVKNLSKDPSPKAITYKVAGTFTNYIAASKTIEFDTLIRKTGVKGLSGQMGPNERVTVQARLDTAVSSAELNNYFKSTADSVDVVLKAEVQSDDINDISNPNFKSLIDARANDTVSSTYHLRSFYAYDDGMAEYSAGLIEAGNLVAYQFDMLSKPDTLIGFDIYFPDYGGAGSDNVDFTIYKDREGKPDGVWMKLTSRPVVRKGINEFHRYRFFPALLIDESKFYIGWKEPASGKIFVGLDIDHDSGEKMYVNTNGTWFQNTDVKGSLMIRPIFGKGDVGAVTGVTEESHVALYPNPNHGEFFIEGKYDQLKIYNVSGQEVTYQSHDHTNRTLIQLHQPSGIYLIRSVTGKKIQTRKVIITR